MTTNGYKIANIGYYVTDECVIFAGHYMPFGSTGSIIKDFNMRSYLISGRIIDDLVVSIELRPIDSNGYTHIYPPALPSELKEIAPIKFFERYPSVLQEINIDICITKLKYGQHPYAIN